MFRPNLQLKILHFRPPFAVPILFRWSIFLTNADTDDSTFFFLSFPPFLALFFPDERSSSSVEMRNEICEVADGDGVGLGLGLGLTNWRSADGNDRNGIGFSLGFLQHRKVFGCRSKRIISNGGFLIKLKWILLRLKGKKLWFAPKPFRSTICVAYKMLKWCYKMFQFQLIYAKRVKIPFPTGSLSKKK